MKPVKMTVQGALRVPKWLTAIWLLSIEEGLTLSENCQVKTKFITLHILSLSFPYQQKAQDIERIEAAL